MNKNIRQKAVLIFVVLASLLISLPVDAGAVQQSTTPTPNDNVEPKWVDPVNLSQSGTALSPRIAAEQDGTVTAIWWDQLDGPLYSFKNDRVNWFGPQSIVAFTGIRSENGVKQQPSDWRVLGAGENDVFIFWIDANKTLFSTQKSVFTETGWTNAQRVAEDVVLWDAKIDMNGGLHVVYIQGGDNADGDAGSYYSHSWTGESWTKPILLDASRYFRSMDAKTGDIGLALSQDRKVVVTWKSPETSEFRVAISMDRGINFQVKAQIDTSSLRDQFAASPEAIHPIAMPDNSFMLLWEAGGTCAIYQQDMTITYEVGNTAQPENPYTLAAAQRVLRDLNGCIDSLESLSTEEGITVFARLNSPSGLGAGTLTVFQWNGDRWSQPYTPNVNFYLTETSRTVDLGCLDFAYQDGSLWAIGCDNQGDIWSIRSAQGLTGLIHNVDGNWNRPVMLSSNTEEIHGVPDITLDSRDVAHMVWAEDQGVFLNTILSTTQRPALILPKVNDRGLWAPTIIGNQDQKLTIAWSESPGGRIYYSQAYERDAGKSDGWQERLPISDIEVGGWPVIISDQANQIGLAFTAPYNEDRGVYYSSYSGGSWKNRQLIQKSAAGTFMVRDTALAVDGNHVYVTWVNSGLPPSMDALGVYFSKSDDGGRSWADPLRISFPDGDNPRILISPSGNLHAVWTRKVGDDLAIWHTYSLDEGTRWSEPEKIVSSGITSRGIDLIADAQGRIFLLAISEVSNGDAQLIVLNWDGTSWGNKDRVFLDSDSIMDGGVNAVISKAGTIYATYLVKNGVGFVQKTLDRLPAVTDQTQLPTFTPQPTFTASPTVVFVGTPTPAPTIVFTATGGVQERLFDWRIWAVMAFLLAIVIYAAYRLKKQRG